MTRSENSFAFKCFYQSDHPTNTGQTSFKDRNAHTQINVHSLFIYIFSLLYYRYSQPLGWTLPAGRRRHDGKHLQSAVVSKKKKTSDIYTFLFFQSLPWIQKVQTLSFLTHRDTGGAFASDLNDCVSSRAVHTWERAVQHADRRRRRQQVHALNHRPFGPAERLRHGFETHLTAERKRE